MRARERKKERKIDFKNNRHINLFCRVLGKKIFILLRGRKTRQIIVTVEI